MGPSPSPPAAVVSCLMERRTITGGLQKQFLVRWVGEGQSDSWHDIDAFIWRHGDLEALSRREGFARLEDDPWYPVDLHTTEGTISSILRQKGAAAEEARAAAEAKAAELVAARAAKEKHQLAIVHGVMPMVMEREEVRKEAKGAGLHLDIVLLCLINFFSSLVGGPWVCAATVINRIDH